MTRFALLSFTLAGILEVGGDAMIRKGLRGGGLIFIATGIASLALYGLVVNTVKWDFARLLGIYVGFFAVLSVLSGRFIFLEVVPRSTWLGLLLIVLGGLVIQLGGISQKTPDSVGRKGVGQAVSSAGHLQNAVRSHETPRNQ
jgi:drug/metabolite transporter superfamily protein YnfA